MTISGLLFALSILFRYAGVFVVPFCVAATVFLSPKHKFKDRITDAVKLALIIGIPFAILALRNVLVASNVTNRTFSVHWPTFTISTFSQLLIPHAVPSWIRVPAAGLVYIVIVTGVYKLLRNVELERTNLRGPIVPQIRSFAKPPIALF